MLQLPLAYFVTFPVPTTLKISSNNNAKLAKEKTKKMNKDRLSSPSSERGGQQEEVEPSVAPQAEDIHNSSGRGVAKKRPSSSISIGEATKAEGTAVTILPEDKEGPRPMKLPPTERNISKKQKTFPWILHQLLEDATSNLKSGNYQDDERIVCWNPSGKAFKVLKRDNFMKHVLPKYFKQTKFKSFVRQLNLWGFVYKDDGPEKGSYMHPKFIQNQPQLCNEMKRQKVKSRIVAGAALPTNPLLHNQQQRQSLERNISTGTTTSAIDEQMTTAEATHPAPWSTPTIPRKAVPSSSSSRTMAVGANSAASTSRNIMSFGRAMHDQVFPESFSTATHLNSNRDGYASSMVVPTMYNNPLTIQRRTSNFRGEESFSPQFQQQQLNYHHHQQQEQQHQVSVIRTSTMFHNRNSNESSFFNNTMNQNTFQNPITFGDSTTTSLYQHPNLNHNSSAYDVGSSSGLEMIGNNELSNEAPRRNPLEHNDWADTRLSPESLFGGGGGGGAVGPYNSSMNDNNGSDWLDRLEAAMIYSTTSMPAGTATSIPSQMLPQTFHPDTGGRAIEGGTFIATDSSSSLLFEPIPIRNMGTTTEGKDHFEPQKKKAALPMTMSQLKKTPPKEKK